MSVGRAWPVPAMGKVVGGVVMRYLNRGFFGAGSRSLGGGNWGGGSDGSSALYVCVVVWYSVLYVVETPGRSGLLRLRERPDSE